MSKVKLIWVTPDTKKQIVEIARVSSPNQYREDGHEKLLKYLVDNKHWSPFEMASACIEINTSRDIGRQILRHRSFHFQEFSQRYAEVSDSYVPFKIRRQDTKNRQNSIDNFNQEDIDEAYYIQDKYYEDCFKYYKNLLSIGVAKEQARKVLPEGMVPTKMYMAGTIRDWYHYCELRTGNGTQLEHQMIAKQCSTILHSVLPEMFVKYD